LGNFIQDEDEGRRTTRVEEESGRDITIKIYEKFAYK
jgi:hypothetical protein